MSNPLIQIGDEVREMNEAEFAQYEKDLATAEAQKQLEAEKAAAKAAALAKLEALGLNEADLTALGL
jgi:hypothetical protein